MNDPQPPGWGIQESFSVAHQMMFEIFFLFDDQPPNTFFILRLSPPRSRKHNTVETPIQNFVLDLETRPGV